MNLNYEFVENLLIRNLINIINKGKIVTAKPPKVPVGSLVMQPCRAQAQLRPCSHSAACGAQAGSDVYSMQSQ